MKKRHQSISGMWKWGLGMLTAGVMAVTMLPAFSFSASAGATDKPTLLKAGSVPVSVDNYTEREPFAQGTAGCERFRIPALITLENGDLLATSDARYGVVDGSDAPDGGGLDSIASVSSDGGKTWHYSFPFYFPDCDGNDGRNATTIIDPSIVEGPDGTVYCFGDVNPTGITTMYGTIRTGTGYVLVNGKPYLALTDDYANTNTEPSDSDLTTYPFYVDDFDENGYAQIRRRDDGSETGYGVDEWYNIYHVQDGKYEMGDLTQKQTNTDTDIQQNAYYKASMFHVYNIGYIWVITSKDHGRTWEHPRNINYQVKRHSGEHAILVSPGKGLTTKDGTIVMGFYNSHDAEENASFIYSSDNGETWRRTEDVPGAALGGTRSSEHEIVELEDGTLRMFFRRGDYLAPVGPLAYVDAKKQEDGTYEFGEVQYCSVSLQTGCNLTAISYSKKIDGKQVILVSGPSGQRVNGVILAFLVNDDAEHSMELIHTFSVPEGQGRYPSYVYSCLTELEDGTVGLLWEPNHYSIRYSSFSINDLIPNRNIPGTSISVEVGKDKTVKKLCVGKGEITKEADAQIASVDVREETKFAMYDHSGTAVASSLDSFQTEVNSSLELSAAEFTFTGSGNTWEIKNETTGQYLTNTTDAEEFFSTDAANMTAAPTDGQNTFRICKADGKRYVIFHAPAMNFNSNSGYTSGDSSYELVLLEKQEEAANGDAIPGYRQVSTITNGKKYLIAHIEDGKVIVLYPTNGKNAQTKLVDPSLQTKSTMIAFHGKSGGYTTAVIDGVEYKIRVTEEYQMPDSSCAHSTSLRSVIPATCNEEGYTGDEVCNLCNGVIKEGEAVAALGHTWDEGVVTKEVTRTTDGEVVYTCQRDSFHTKTKTIYASAYAQFLDGYEEVSWMMGNLGMYTEETAAPVKAAYEMANQLYTEKKALRSEMYQSAEALKAAKDALVEKTADTLKAELDVELKAAKADYEAGQGNLPEDIWINFANAYRAAERVSADAEPKVLWTLASVLKTARENMTETKNGQALAEAKKELAAVVASAKSRMDAGQGKYTTESWNVFTAAYKAAANAPANADAAALHRLKTALEKAQSELKTASAPDPVIRKGDEASIGNGRYQVQDAEKKTAVLVSVKNKKAVKLNVPATVKIHGVTCKVVAVKAKVMKGNTKLKTVVLGKNVTTIGKQAFMGCKNLKSVQLKGKGLKTVQSGAFRKTSAKMVVRAKGMNKKQKALLFKKLKKAGMSKKGKVK